MWRSLQHLGVTEADLEDLLQEVFVVVHRKLSGFDGKSKVTTWLFGICLRVTARHRRKAYFRRERATAEPPEQADTKTPEGTAVLHDDRRRLARALARLSLEQRAVFVLFELEGQSCQQIADLVGAPIGTVYSRLHQARARVARSLAKTGLRVPGGET